MLHTLIIPAVVATLMGSPSSSNGICSQLDTEPTVGGVVEVVIAVMSEGYTSKDAAELIVGTVQSQCPEYIPLLNKFVQKYG